jgi:hypothetical protein
MELVKDYVDQWEKRQPKAVTIREVKAEISSQLHTVYAEAFFNGVSIGALQGISYEEPQRNESGMSGRLNGNEVTITIDTEHNSFLQELLDEERIMRMGYYYEETDVNESRSERRKKSSRKKGDSERDDYRDGVRRMLGGKKRWN